MEGIKITHLDYRELLQDGNEAVFTFLDPPYFKATKSRLYGKNGVLHTGFNHDEFAQEMKKCKHSWLITYDNSPEILEEFRVCKYLRMATSVWDEQLQTR